MPQDALLKQIRNAFVEGFYAGAGAGDDAWYRDHKTPDGSLIENAFVRRPLREYLTGLKLDALFQIPTTELPTANSLTDEQILERYNRTFRAGAKALFDNLAYRALDGSASEDRDFWSG